MRGNLLRPAAFGAFAATLLAVSVIASFGIGVRGTFDDPGGGIAPTPATPPRCLELAYHGNYASWQLPASLRLTSDVVPAEGRGGSSYRAIDRSGARWTWRPAGPDSIDIVGHHSPVIRIPMRGDPMVGRVGALGYNTIWEALLARPDGRVSAREVRCPPPDDTGP